MCGKIYLIEPSKKLSKLQQYLKYLNNVVFINSKIEDINFESNYFDFAISLGVLHHIDIEKNLNIIKSH